MDPTLNKKKGQALVETAIMLPLFVMIIFALMQFHRVVIEQFEVNRILRKTTTSWKKNQQKDNLIPSEKKERLTIEIKNSFPQKSMQKNKIPSTLGNLDIATKALESLLFIDLLIQPRTVTIKHNPEGLWDENRHQNTLLIPGTLREQSHSWIRSYSLLRALIK